MKRTRLFLILVTLLLVVMPVSASAHPAATTQTITVKAVISYSGTACVFPCTALRPGTATLLARGQTINGVFNNPGYIARDLVIYFYNVPVDSGYNYCSGNIQVNAFREQRDWGQVTRKPLSGTWQGCIGKPWYAWNQEVHFTVTDSN